MAGRSAASHTAGLSTSASGVKTQAAVAAWADGHLADSSPALPVEEDYDEAQEEEEQRTLLSPTPKASASTAPALAVPSSAPPAALKTPPPRQASQRKLKAKASASSQGAAASGPREGTGVEGAGAGAGGGGGSGGAVQSTPVRARPVSQWAAGLASSVWGRLGNSTVGRELQALLPMAAPVMAASCLTQLLNIVDLMFVGNFLGTEYLAAAALGNCWFNILSALFLGGSSGIDRLCSAAPLDSGAAAEGGALAATAAAPLEAAPSPAAAAAAGTPRAGRQERGRGYTVLQSPGAMALGAAPLGRKLRAASLPAEAGGAEQGAVGGVEEGGSGGAGGPAAGAAGAAVVWAQRGVFLMALLSLPIMVALSLTEEFLVIFGGQEVETSFVAAGFCDSLVLGLLPLTVSTALGRFLGSQGLVWPGITVDILANLLNLSLNAALIRQDGFLGAPLATSVARVAHLGMLLAYISLRWRGALLPAPAPQAAQAAAAAAQPSAPAPAPAAESWWSARGLATMASAMATGAFVVALESWPLELSNLLAGRLDVPSLDAHTVMLNTCVFVSLGLPTGVGVAASSRIPALLAAGDALGARKTALVSILTSLTYNLAVATVLLGVRGHMGALFTSDEEVAVQCAHTALIAALFQLMDGTQCVLACVLRGLEWGGVVTALLFFGWTAIGLPLAWFLAFHIGGHGWGLFGLWLGMLVGVTSIMLAFFAIFRSVDWDVEAKRALEARRWQEEQRARAKAVLPPL